MALLVDSNEKTGSLYDGNKHGSQTQRRISNGLKAGMLFKNI